MNTTETINKIKPIKKVYNFNPDAKKIDVQRHHQALLAALYYHRKRNNTDKVKEVEDEIGQMKNVYPYIK